MRVEIHWGGRFENGGGIPPFVSLFNENKNSIKVKLL